MWKLVQSGCIRYALRVTIKQTKNQRDLGTSLKTIQLIKFYEHSSLSFFLFYFFFLQGHFSYHRTCSLVKNTYAKNFSNPGTMTYRIIFSFTVSAKTRMYSYLTRIEKFWLIERALSEYKHRAQLKMSGHLPNWTMSDLFPDFSLAFFGELKVKFRNKRAGK